MKIAEMREYFPTTAGRPVQEDTLQLMTKMYNIIEKKPGIASAQIARDLEVHGMTCSNLGIRLEEKGLITITREGRALHYEVGGKKAKAKPKAEVEKAEKPAKAKQAAGKSKATNGKTNGKAKAGEDVEWPYEKGSGKKTEAKEKPAKAAGKPKAKAKAEPRDEALA